MRNNVERIENNEINNGKLKVADGDDFITPKIYQAIYHQITGRTEKISKNYKNNLLIDFEEVKQLHKKILQLTDVHHTIAQNQAIVIYYDNDRKEEFTSFERFEKYNSSNSKTTLNLVLKYSFSIQLPEVEKPQSYTLTIKLNSRLAIIETFAREAPSYIPYGLLALVHSNTADISVEYVDYIVAKNFVKAFDDWIDSCNSIPNNKYLKFFQSKSKHIPMVFQIIIGAISVYSFLSIIETLPDIFSQVWGRFFVISFVSFFFLLKASSFIGSLIERYIDSFYQDSYLNLTRGDEKLVKRSISRKRNIVMKIIFNVLLTIVLGIISSKLAPYI
ncbi:hypothetical protein [Psychrobacter piscatorii]|uniref:hypothetical protein n=1 Tax=Psychrobacter piscatorii TaxID=554343 RepID=UPI00373648EC